MQGRPVGCHWRPVYPRRFPAFDGDQHVTVVHLAHQRNLHANASYGESYLLVTILAAVLGGVDPMGGFGRVSGVILALAILQVISTAFNLLDLSQFLTLAIWGGTLIAVACLKAILHYVRSRG